MSDWACVGELAQLACVSGVSFRPEHLQPGLSVGCARLGLIGLGLFLLPGRVIGLSLRLRLRVGGSLAFIGQAHFVHLLDCDRARIFGSLHCFAGRPRSAAFWSMCLLVAYPSALFINWTAC